MFKYIINEVDNVVSFQDLSTSLDDNDTERKSQNKAYKHLEFDEDILNYFKNNNIDCFAVPVQKVHNCEKEEVGFLVVKQNSESQKQVSVYHYHQSFIHENTSAELKYIYNNHQGLISLLEDKNSLNAANLEQIILSSPQEKNASVFEHFIASIHAHSIRIIKDEFFISSELKITKEQIKFKVHKKQKDIEYYILDAFTLDKVNSDKPGSVSKYYKLSMEEQNSAAAILDKSTTFIYIYDITTKKIVYSNFKHKKYLDFYEDEWNNAKTSLEDKFDDINKFLETSNDKEKDPVIRQDFEFFSKETKTNDWYSSSKRIYKRDENGNPVQIIVYSNDITRIIGEKQAFKTAYDYNKALMDAIPELVFVLNKEGYVLHVFEGKSQDDYNPDLNIIGKNTKDILPKHQAEVVLKTIKKAIKTKQNVDFYLDREIDGTVYNLNCSCSPVDNEKVILLVKNETKIVRMQKQLEEQVAEISFKNEELENYILKNDNLEHFSFILSHDLKESLRGISGFSEIIQNNYISILDEKAVQYFQYIRKSVTKMNKQLDSVIEYSEISEVGLLKENVSLKDILAEVEERIVGRIQEKSIVIKTDYSPIINCDKKLITKVFVNLILNSVESCPSCTEVVVYTDKIDDKYQITVKDNGKGIDEAKLVEVFKMFKKLDHTDKNGMGLAISKKIIEYHGGKIWIESNNGFKGTKVIFTIPI